MYFGTSAFSGYTPSPLRRTGCLYVFQRDRLMGIFRADGTTQEAVLVEDTDLTEVARVVANRDAFADIGSKDRAHKTQPLKMHTVAAHESRLCDHDEQQVEVVDTVGHLRKPAVGAPRRQRRQPRLAMSADIVGVLDPRADDSIEIGQRQLRRCCWFPVHYITGQVRKQLCV